MEHLTVISGSGDTFELSLPSQEEIGRIAAIFRETISLPRALFRERVISNLQEYFPVSYRSPLERITVSDAFKLASALMTLADAEAPSAPAPGTFVSSVFPENFSCKVCVSPSNISLPGAGELLPPQPTLSFSGNTFSSFTQYDTPVSEKRSFQQLQASVFLQKQVPFSDTFFTSSLQTGPSDLSHRTVFSVSGGPADVSAVPALFFPVLHAENFHFPAEKAPFSLPITVDGKRESTTFSLSHNETADFSAFYSAAEDFSLSPVQTAVFTVPLTEDLSFEPQNSRQEDTEKEKGKGKGKGKGKKEKYSFSENAVSEKETYFFTPHPRVRPAISHKTQFAAAEKNLFVTTVPREAFFQAGSAEEGFSGRETPAGGKLPFSSAGTMDNMSSFSQEVILAAYHFKWSLEYAASLPPELLLRCLETALAAANGITSFPRTVSAAPQFTAEEIWQAVKRGAEALERFKKS